MKGLQRLPLAPKITIILVLVGLLAWLLADRFQTRYMERVFREHLMNQLSDNAMDARIRFDSYVAAQNYSARLIVSQKAFFDYLTHKMRHGWQDGLVRRLNDRPQWLPDTSVLRGMTSIRYALLFDGAVQVREVYQGWPDPVPLSLLQPSDLLRKLSSNQSYMTTVEGRPYSLTSEFVKDETGRVLGGIMIASPLDDFFLAATQATADERFPIALLSVDEPKVVASSSPELFPRDTPLKDLQKNFFIVGKTFFDSGSSDLSIQFFTLTSKTILHDVSSSLLKRGRWVSTLIAALFVFCGLLITFYFTGQLKVLTGNIVSFSKALFPERSASAEGGDEIRILGREFDLFKDSIVASRETVQRQTAELLQEKAQLQEALANIKVLKGLLPICASCKKVREDTGYWTQIETYIRSRTDAEFTHGLCPECLQQFKKEVEELKPINRTARPEENN